MTYSIYIDQVFAERHRMTLVEVTNLASIITLPTWSDTIAIEGKVWYKYSERKLAQDFPLLYSDAKRCYKNLKVLEKKGYIEMLIVGKAKYVRFMPVCEEWGRSKDIQTEGYEEQDQKNTASPKMDSQSKIGLQDQNRIENSPKLDQHNNILNNYNYIINSSSSSASAHVRMREWVADNSEQMQIEARRNRLTENIEDIDALLEIYDQYIKVFVEDEQVRDEIGRGLRADVKKHFWNWLPKYIKAINNNENRTNQQSTTRSAQSVASDADYWDV